MYFGFPGLALILVVSAAPKEKIVEGVGDETNQELEGNTTDPIRGADPLQPRHLPWSRSIGTRPPEPKAGSRTQLGALPLGYPPHRSWSEGDGRTNLFPSFTSHCVPPKMS